MSEQIQDQAQSAQDDIPKASSDWMMKLGVLVILSIIGLQMNSMFDREEAARLAVPLAEASELP